MMAFLWQIQESRKICRDKVETCGEPQRRINESEEPDFATFSVCETLVEGDEKDPARIS
jgi:hypothetical protein